MMSDVLDYKKIQIRNKDLFEISCNLMEKEGFEVHQMPTFIAFVQKKPDSSGLRPKIIFKAKEDEPIRGYMGANGYYPVIFDANVESIIDDIAESLGIGSIQSDNFENHEKADDYETDVDSNTENDYFKQDDDMKNYEYLNNTQYYDPSNFFETPSKITEKLEEKNKIVETKENNKNSDKGIENEWISVNVELPQEDVMVEIAYSSGIYINYKFAFLKSGTWYEEYINFDGENNALNAHNVLAWKKHVPYRPQTIKDFFDKSANKGYDFVCIKNSKNVVLGTMIVKNGRPVVETVKSCDSFSLADAVVNFEEWSQKEIGIDSGLTITVMR